MNVLMKKINVFHLPHLFHTTNEIFMQLFSEDMRKQSPRNPKKNTLFKD